MKQKIATRILSVLLASCFIIGGFDSSLVVSADSTLTSEEQKFVLEQKLKQVESRLKNLGKKSTETEEYLETLEERLGYLKQQYALSQAEWQQLQNQVDATELEIDKNQQAIQSATEQSQLLQEEFIKLSNDFDDTYNKYCQRIRALYVSRDYGSWATFLLESDGVENLLIRLQMMESVTQQDAQLMEQFNTEMDQMFATKESIQNQKESLQKNQLALEQNQVKLREQRATLLLKQEELHTHQTRIEAEQQSANQLLQSLHEKTQNYGEFRDITQQELEQIDADIAAADQKYATHTTTTTRTTTKKSNNQATTKQTATQRVQYISLTYPCPSYTAITCAFGEYAGHTGCDFSTKGHENEKIVAAESGTVILVRLLETSYGHYLVIRHDKTTKSGEAVYTLYAHNNDIVVKEGQKVKKGQLIAYSGTTGNSTGPHCHFEVRVGGSSQSYAKDPKNYF